MCHRGEKKIELGFSGKLFFTGPACDAGHERMYNRCGSHGLIFRF